MENNYPNEELKEEDKDHQDEHYYNQPQPLQREQKIAATFLAVFGVFVLIMWMAQLKKSIISPLDNLAGQQSATQQEASTCTGSNCAGNDENLKFKDTDGDGLTDYDELYIYKTSPYLEDSDSDGLTDSAEIAGEKDPNCPEGVDCYGSALLSDEEEGEAEIEIDLSDSIETQNLLTTPETISTGQEEYLNTIMSGEGNVAMLRQALLDFGMDAEVLNQISDEDLMASYQDILKNQ